MERRLVQKMYHTLTKRYCARAIFCGNFRYNPPVMSQAYKNNTAWFRAYQDSTVYTQSQKNVPAEEDLNQSPRRRHLSECSVLKYTQVMFLLNIQVTNTTDWVSLPASGQRRWHSWSSCTGEHSLQQLLPPIQQIKVAVFRNKGKQYQSTYDRPPLDSPIFWILTPVQLQK